MRHNYRHFLAYNPAKKEVTQYTPLSEQYLFNGRLCDEEFYKIWDKSDHTTEMILGISLTNDIYQLSPAEYGTYVKEDYYSGEQVNKGSVLVAIANYKKKHHLPFNEY